MATANVIALSSSPPRSPITTMSPPGFIAIMSSSPGLPSPSMLMRTKRPSLVSGSCAAHMPEKAAVGFASAAGLMIADSPGLGLDAPIAVLTNKGYGHSGSADKFGPDSREEGKTKPKKWAPATVEGVIAAKKSRTPSKKTKKNANMDGVVAHATVLEEFRLPNVEKKPRKPRSKKDKDATQPKIKKGKITKPGTNDGIEKTAIKRKTTPMIKACTVPDSDPNDFGVLTAEQDLGLDEAIRRRKSWTPPKDTSRMAEVSNKDTGSTTESMGAAQESAFEQPAKSFGNLCSSFGYDQPAQSDFAPQALRNLDGVAMTKRRRIEPENLLPGPPAAVPAKRSKSLKKKPQTITEKATAKYAPEDPTPAAPLLQYFAFQEPDTSGDSQGINKESVTQVRAPAKPARRRSSVKSTTAKRKSKKGTVALPILLSPESALKNAKDQDILFGTSSQLMGDESPTFLRDLQQAMKVSEAMPDQDPFVDSGYGDDTPRPEIAKGLRTAPRSSSGGLWSIAARDLDGCLLDAEVVDLANSSPACQVHNDIKSRGEAPKAAERRSGHFALPTASDEGGSWMVLDDLATAEPENAARGNMRQVQEATGEDEPGFMAKSIAEASLRKRPRSKSPVKRTSKTKGKTTSVSSKIMQKPDFTGYPSTQLASELASYGFKPVKNRDQMIALLEKCWEGQNRVALQSLATNANLLTSESPVSTTVIEADCSPPKRSTKVLPMKKSKNATTLTKLPRRAKPTDEAETAPKKPRGRPRKNTASSTAAEQLPKEAWSKAATVSPELNTPDKARRKATAITVEEIDDSDTPPTPSPPRRRSSPTTPRPLALSPPTAEQTPNLTPTAGQKHLFAKITKAITTLPTTTDPKHPTWHEKILMYDPIVLEDLATWLNTEGLGRVGVDEEVGPTVVRAWCEERSVCCLWKENLRGGVRPRC